MTEISQQAISKHLRTSKIISINNPIVKEALREESVPTGGPGIHALIRLFNDTVLKPLVTDVALAVRKRMGQKVLLHRTLNHANLRRDQRTFTASQARSRYIFTPDIFGWPCVLSVIEHEPGYYLINDKASGVRRLPFPWMYQVVWHAYVPNNVNGIHHQMHRHHHGEKSFCHGTFYSTSYALYFSPEKITNPREQKLYRSWLPNTYWGSHNENFYSSIPILCSTEHTFPMDLEFNSDVSVGSKDLVKLKKKQLEMSVNNWLIAANAVFVEDFNHDNMQGVVYSGSGQRRLSEMFFAAKKNKTKALQKRSSDYKLSTYYDLWSAVTPEQVLSFKTAAWGRAIPASQAFGSRSSATDEIYKNAVKL